MRVTSSGFGKIVTVAMLSGFLAACSSSGDNKVENTLTPTDQQLLPQVNQASLPAPDAIQDPRAYCPRATIRGGTESYNVYPPKTKPDDPELSTKLRFRGTVREVVRECNTAGEFLNIKVGIAGRAVSGPSGETGTFTMPIRIAVTRGDEVLYSQLHEVMAEIPPGRTNNTFSFVDAAISIPRPDKENVIIYVGYDELRVDVPGAVAPKEKLKPVN
ncbi:MAG: hypothetical protein WBO55_18735 [Rhizobiaceae bacterium]